MSINRNRDRDITARQPLLDNTTTVGNSGLLVSGTGSVTAGIVPGNVANSMMNNVGGSIGGGGGITSRHSGTKYSKLENSMDSPSHYATMDSPSHRFLGESVSAQQRMLQSQDEQLDVISDSIGTLKTVSRQIGTELDEQAV